MTVPARHMIGNFAVQGRACYLKVTKAPHNIESMTDVDRHMGDIDPTLIMVRFLKTYILDDVLFNLTQLIIVVPVNRYNIFYPIFSNTACLSFQATLRH